MRWGLFFALCGAMGYAKAPQPQDSSQQSVSKLDKIVLQGKKIVLEFIDKADKEIALCNVPAQRNRHTVFFQDQNNPLHCQVDVSHEGAILVQGGDVEIKGQGFNGSLTVDAGKVVMETKSSFQKLDIHAGTVDLNLKDLSCHVDIKAGLAKGTLHYKNLNQEKISRRGLRFGAVDVLRLKIGNGDLDLKVPKGFKVSFPKNHSFIKTTLIPDHKKPDLRIKAQINGSLQILEDA